MTRPFGALGRGVAVEPLRTAAPFTAPCPVCKQDCDWTHRFGELPQPCCRCEEKRP